MNSTAAFPNPEQESTNRKWSWVLAFLAGFLVALICLGYVLHSVLKTNGELEGRITKQTEELKQRSAQLMEMESRVASYESDMATVRDKLKITQGQLIKSRKELKTLSTEGVQTKSAQRTFTVPVWNVWAEPASGSADSAIFKPQRLQRKHDYSFVVDLAALHFDEDQTDKDAGVYSKDSSTKFRDWIDNPENKDLPSASVKVLIIPDRVHFRPQGDHEALKQMRIELAKIRDVKQKGFSLSGSALKYLRLHGGEAPFSFGLKTFQITTTDEVGIGYISVSIWKNDRPIGELQYTTCVGNEIKDPCNPPLVPESTFKGIDLRDSDQVPAAALHLIDRQVDIVGIFHCHACDQNSDEYITWEVPETRDSFERKVDAIIRRLDVVKPIHNGETNEEFAKRKQREYLERSHASSEALYNLIFGSKKDSDGLKAKAAFIEFVRHARKVEEQNDIPPPAFFVRVIPSVPRLVLTPVSLLEVTSPDPASPKVAGRTDFGLYAGFYLEIQTPLEIQDYSDSKDCISKWTLFVPPSTAEGNLAAVEEARQSFSPWIEGFKKACRECVMDDEDEHNFRHFLNGEGPDADAVLMLSHHSSEIGLYFDESDFDPAIITSDIGRTFNDNSIAILGACGTAAPVGSEFITQFNKMGIRSVIATTTAVEPSMTGRFLTLFLNSFNSTSETNTIGQARFQAIRKLSQEEDLPGGALYGPRALVFILAGNAGRHLCVPPKGPEPSAITQKEN
jgi:hypothetical protein